MSHCQTQVRSIPRHSEELIVALAGNPNSGKTTIFNALTGLRQKVANYPGVTVEKKFGWFDLPDGRRVSVIDLPGAYSLVSQSPDERVTLDVLRGSSGDPATPDVVVAIIDASNLQRNLYLVSQLIELRKPMAVVLNMVDVASRRGLHVSAETLERKLGMPLVPVVGHRGKGIKNIKNIIFQARLPPLQDWPVSLDDPSNDSAQADIEARYRWIESVVETSEAESAARRPLSDRVDAIVVHKLWGLLIFAVIMAALFVTLFWLAQPLMDGMQNGITWLGASVAAHLPAGPVHDLVKDGIFAGVGTVVAFVPQIALLFAFLAILEDSGYLVRAAFMMDRLLAKVGLHGKSFIPLLSSFACAIPGILATRTIENRKDRLATIFVAPFMSCSARLPVYVLLIGTFFAGYGANVQAGIMLVMYAVGILAAAATAWVFRRTLLKGPSHSFILELPPYKIPQPLSVLRQCWSNTAEFLKKAGTIILCFSIVLWAMTYYGISAKRMAELNATAAPADVIATERMNNSIASRFGHILEPALRPLGFDWKIGVGLVSAFGAREVFVSTMGIVYSAQNADQAGTVDLAKAMQADHYTDGQPVWTPLVAVSLLIWFVLAMQCMSTLAVVRRETRTWTWPIFMVIYMNALAYGSCLLIYQVGRMW